MTTDRRPSPWHPLTPADAHPLAAIEGAEVGNGVRLSLERGPQSKVGSDYFRAYLVADDLGRTAEPFLWGLINRGPFPGFNWVEVTDSTDRVPLASGDEVAIPEGIDLAVVQALGRDRKSTRLNSSH